MKFDSSRRPVAVEDLLRLKRAERPPAEFWTEFDRQLRAKQLAALVTKRPWWQTLPRIWSGLPRYRLLLGAAAALAVGFISLRQSPSGAVESSPVEIARVAASPDSPAMSARLLELSSITNETDSTPGIPAVQESQPTSSNIANHVASAGQGLGEELSAQVSNRGISSSGQALIESSLPNAANSLNGALGVAAAVAPAKRSILSASTPFEAGLTRVRTPVEPLQQMTPPGEARRTARFMTAMVSTVSATEASLRSTERNSRIDEERLYDQVRRVNARGAGLDIKF